jgi:hypothetical protein
MLMIAMIYHRVTVNCSLDIRYYRRGMLVLPQNLVSVGVGAFPSGLLKRTQVPDFCDGGLQKQDAQRSTVIASI